MEDEFKLGNFEGVNSDDKPVEDSEKSQDRILEQVGRDVEEISGEMTKHPTVKADPQAKFRTKDGKPLLEIELTQIVPNEYQPRRIFDQAKLEELAASIKEHGIIQPLVVVPREDGKYEIVVGERRFRAARLAGLERIPVFVNPKLSSEAKLEIALIENIQRADLNPIEEAKAYERLHKEFGLSVGEIAKHMGKDLSTISNLTRLLKLPAEILRALSDGTISEGQARPLLSLRDNEEILQMFQIIIKQQMKVRDIENKVREIRQRRIKVKDMFTPDPFLQSLENLLRNKLGTRVEVNKGAKGGRIMIEFFSDEELNDIVGKIS